MAIKIDVVLPPQLKGLDAEIRRRSRRLIEDVTGQVAVIARKNVGHQGPLAASIDGHATGDFDGEVVATAEYAKAQEEGAFIRPRKGKMLKFTDTRTGKVVYTRGPVRLKAKKYMAKARGKSRAIVNDAVRKHFGDLGN